MTRVVTCSILVFVVTLVSPATLHAAPPKQPTGDDAILKWNAIALDAVVDDHSGTFGTPEQGGPTRTARALAIVHIAMYDAVNAIDGSFVPFIPVTRISPSTINKAAIDAAVAKAARDTLVAMYPKQTAVFDRELNKALNGIPANRGRGEGVSVGAKAAANILSDRSTDGAAAGNRAIYPVTVPLPGEHQPDPLNPLQGLLTPGWGRVATFSAINVMDVRAPAPPKLTSEACTHAFKDVAALGGDGIITPTIRTKEQTEIGLFWAYDGAKGIGVPPRLYNQIVRVIAKQEKNTLVENARLFALVNIAMADAGIATWDSKYFYNYWRPVMGIRKADTDGNRATVQVDNWTPLGAPASNQSGNNFTPPFPAYPSGHASFGGATFRILCDFYGTDFIAYRLKSDELSGRATDSQGDHRYSVVRRFDSFSQGAIENGRSRIYLGIHWQFDADSGIVQGATVADYVFENLLQPAP